MTHIHYQLIMSTNLDKVFGLKKHPRSISTAAV